MIKPTDAALLAYTKLRTRKVRLIITVVISALLFSALAGASLIARGAFASLASFNKEGFGDRYIVGGTSQSFIDFFNNQSVIARATDIQKDLVARKKAEAKRLDIEYDAANDPPPVTEYDTPGGKQKSLNPEHPASEQAIQEFLATQESPGLPEMEALAKPYGAKAFYRQKAITSYAGAGGATIQVLKDGKESFNATDKPAYGPPTGTDSFISGWSVMSKELMRPFLLPGVTLKVGADGVIPVVAPYTAVEQLLKLTPLTAGASPAERLVRLQDVRTRAKDLKFSVCYRNETSAMKVGEAISVQEEIDRNKTTKDYQKPALILGLPKDPCGPVVITQDKRTAEEKKLADKQETFRQIFGELPAKQQLVSFRVAGITPDPPTGQASVVTELISGLVMSYLGLGWFSPLEVEQQPFVQELQQAKSAAFFNPMENTYFAELTSASQAKKLIEEKNCEPQSFAVEAGVDSALADLAAGCIKKGKPFGLIPFGSSSLALDGVKKGFGKWFSIAALVIAGIASIIMMGIVGRTIADSRRETAVFRAIGAKRLDIAQIYLTYAIFLGILVGVVALVGGLSLATVANSKWSEELTVSALVAFNAADLTKTFHLYGFYARDLLYIVGLLLAAGIISTIPPLLRNARRNPIRDMRDEN